MDADEVVINEVSAIACWWFSNFFEKAFVSRVIRRECIRTFKLFRSAQDVLTCLGSGWPSIVCLTMPVHSAGL